MKVAVVSANLGGYDAPREWPVQACRAGVKLQFVRLHDGNFPPRPLAMTSRLQCGIPKWFAADFVAADTDIFIWIDASCVPTPIAVEWFLEKLGDADIAVFAHPDRKTIRDEYEFIGRKLADGNRYLTSRYKGEWLDEQFQYWAARGYGNAPLFASTAFVYRNIAAVQMALREVFMWKARHHLHDQLAFAGVLQQRRESTLSKGGFKVNVIPDNYLKCPALEYVRNKK